MKTPLINKILKHLKAEWWKYGLETLVVVIGILIAFMLNNWNEGRKADGREKKLLIELVNNLEANVETLNVLNQTQTRGIQGIDTILGHFKNVTSADSLRRLFARTIYTETLDLSYSTFETIKSIGFDVIQNDQVRVKIIDLFEVQYAHFTNTVNEVSPAYFKSFTDWNLHHRHEIDGILNSPELRNGDNYHFVKNYIESKKVWKNAIIENDNRLIDQTIEVKELITDYLENGH